MFFFSIARCAGVCLACFYTPAPPQKVIQQLKRFLTFLNDHGEDLYFL